MIIEQVKSCIDYTSLLFYFRLFYRDRHVDCTWCMVQKMVLSCVVVFIVASSLQNMIYPQQHKFLCSWLFCLQKQIVILICRYNTPQDIIPGICLLSSICLLSYCSCCHSYSCHFVYYCYSDDDVDRITSIRAFPPVHPYFCPYPYF